MKKSITALFFVGLLISKANAQNYTFTHFTDTYVPIDNGLPLWVDTSWSYLENNIPKLTPIGFTFRFWDFPHTNVIVRNNGTVALKKSTQPAFNDKIAVCFTQLTSRTFSNPWVSKIHYTTTGSAPERIFIVEYRNVGLELANDTSMFLNFQLWLYESDYSIEVRIGPNNCDTTAWFYSKGPYIGLDTMNTFKGLYLSGNPTNPVWVASVDSQLTGTPPNGMVYRFVPAPRTSMSETTAASFHVYPNPARTSPVEIYGSTAIEAVSVTDLSGRQQHCSVKINKHYATVETAELSSGIYVFNIKTALGHIIKKVVVE
jgi:hypothetical protein